MSASERWLARFFGPFAIERDGVPAKFRTRKTAELAAFLASTLGQWHSRDDLAERFWPESSPNAGRQSLRMALSDIRSVLGDAAIGTDREGVAMSPELVDSDLERMKHVHQDAPSDAGRRVHALLEALGAVHTLPIDIPVDDRLVAMIAEVTCEALELSIVAREFQEGARVGRRILEVLGMREDVAIQLIRLYNAQGTPTLAIAQFEVLEIWLAENYGTKPSPAALEALDEVGATHATKPPEGLIGREETLEMIARALARGRLVTLFGPGGSGKTTVARAWASSNVSSRRRCPFIDLSGETTVAGALTRIQLDLGVPAAPPPEAPGSIVRTLENQDVVLILDNLEQLLPDIAETIAGILELAPRLKLLLTSRVVTGLDAERRIPVEPLRLPTIGQPISDLRRIESVQLFERHALRANPRFSITAQNAVAVATLCRTVDGLPLGLELAAARTAHFTPSEIVEGLKGSLDFVRHSGEQDSRHANLVRTIGWSYPLLSSAARDLARDLSFISGVFSRDAARALSGDDADAAIEELVSSSFLVADTTEREARFWMLETVRGFLQSESERSGSTQSAMTRLLAFFRARAASILESDTRRQAKLDRLREDAENYFSCLAFGAEHIVPGTAELVLAIAPMAGVYNYTSRLGPIARRVFDWPEAALAPNLRARVGSIWVQMGSNVGDLDEQIEILDRCEQHAADDLAALVEVHTRRGIVWKATGDYDKARDAFEWVLANGKDSDPVERANTHYFLGLVACCLGDHPTSLACHQEALRVARAGDDLATLVRILFDLGSELAHQGRGSEAIECFEEAVEHCRSINSRKLEGLTRWQQGDALLSMDRPREALDVLQQSVQYVLDAGFEAGLKWIFLEVGDALAHLGHPILATKVLAKAVETRLVEKRQLAVYEQEDVDRIVATLKSGLGNLAFERHWAEGAREEWSALIEQVLSISPPG